MEDILVPIFICVILPVSIVLITSLTKINGDNKRSQIIIKAIEANREVDTDKLIESLKKPQKSSREILNARLQRGWMYSLIGAVLSVFSFINLANGTGFDDDSVSIPLLFGGISLAVGVSYLITYFVTRKQEK